MKVAGSTLVRLRVWGLLLFEPLPLLLLSPSEAIRASANDLN